MKLETWAILLVLLPAAVSAQTGVTGTWRADPSVPLTIVLSDDASRTITLMMPTPKRRAMAWPI